nr:30S ribosomal protein S14 [Cavernulicola chilensis]
MSSKIKKDKKFRKNFSKTESLVYSLRKIKTQDSAPTNIKVQALKQLYNTFPLTRIKNRCIFSGRSRSVYRQFKISRILLREWALSGRLHGVKKSTW